MKKFLVFFAIILAVLIVVCISLRLYVNDKISSKIDELNKNGFAVTYSSSHLPMKILGSGEIQVVDALKVIDYLFSKIEDKTQLSKNLKIIISFINSSERQLYLEGMVFEYDFDLNIITSKLNLDIFLNRLSTYLMKDLLNKDDDLSKSFLDLLKHKDLKLTVNENIEYKLKDFSLLDMGELISFNGIVGDTNSLKIASFKIVGEDSILNIEDTLFFYNEKDELIDTKLSIGGIFLEDNFEDGYEKLNLKSLVLSSKYSVKDDIYKDYNTVSFDSFNFIQDIADFSSINIALNSSKLNFVINNFPYKKYQDLINSFEDDFEKYTKVFSEFLEEISKNNLSIKLDGEANSYSFSDEKIFEKLKYEALLNINKNLSLNTIFNLEDIFENIKITVDVDSIFADKLIENYKKMGVDINSVASNEDGFKRFIIDVKDSLYINDKKILDLKDLNLSSYEDYEDEDELSYIQDFSDSLTYTYNLVDNNTLRLNFKYKAEFENLSSGAIAVSFPQLKDFLSIKNIDKKSFENVNIINVDEKVFNPLFKQDVIGEYLLIEAFDENWSSVDNQKEFSVDIDISQIQNYFEINLRAYSTNKEQTVFEIIPNEYQSYVTDWQLYPVRLIDINLNELRFQNN